MGKKSKNGYQSAANEQQPFKIIIIGESGVGKSCMMMRYMNQKYLNDYSATIGVEFQSKKITLSDNTQMNLQIWDTAGQESFRAIVKTFYRNSHAIFIVYNIAKQKSFLECDNWLMESTEHALPNALKVLIGTQCDRTDRQVSQEEGEKYKIQRQYDYFFETSAKTGENIDEVFKVVAEDLYSKHLKDRISSSVRGNGERLKKGEDKEKDGGCC